MQTLPHEFQTEDSVREAFEACQRERAQVKQLTGWDPGPLPEPQTIAVIPIAVTRSQDAEVVSLLLEDIERQYGFLLLKERFGLLEETHK